MVRKRSKRKFYKSASVPAEDYNLIKEWVNSGESPYVHYFKTKISLQNKKD